MAALSLSFVLLPAVARAAEVGPQGVVRQFCQADGVGERVSVQGWADIAPLVSWTLEPSWDQVVLIDGYEVGAPRKTDDSSVAVDVRYTVVGQVTARGLDAALRVENVEFRLAAANGVWRIGAPPPPPHIFANRADVEPMRQSLEQGGRNFLPDTVFVSQMYRSAGWDVALQTTAELLSGTTYRSVAAPEAKPGDLVLYLRDGVPYHVGLLEAPDRVVSSTLNTGIVRSTVDTFAGEVRYMRLVRPEADVVPASAPDQQLAAGSGAVPSLGSRQRAAGRKRTPTPKTQASKTPAFKARSGTTKTTQRAPAKPMGKKHVKKSTGRSRPTPTPGGHAGAKE